MSSIIIPGEQKHDKECLDWTPLRDGTRVGDCKYCDLSIECRQIGYKSDWYQFRNMETGEQNFDYFCTGFKVTEDTRKEDKEVS